MIGGEYAYAGVIDPWGECSLKNGQSHGNILEPAERV
jgi:hypothetical protein